MGMEEFADFTEKVQDKSLTPEEIAENEELLNREFEEDNFIFEDFLPSD